MDRWLTGFVLTTSAVGLALALALILVASLITRRSLLHWLPLAAVTMIFLAMSHLPLPPAEGGCPHPLTDPQLMPFRLWRDGAALVTRVYLLSTLANFLLFVVIGGLLSRHVKHAGVAVAGAAALSLAVELSQLTGMFGLFPCPWRQFDVDDLILNVAGVLAGFLGARRISRRRAGG